MMLFVDPGLASSSGFAMIFIVIAVASLLI